jgi:hypothetical protein
MSKHSDVHHLVAKLLTLPGADTVVQGHPWRHEADREHELVFAVLTRALPLPEHDVRAIARRLRFLGLLDLHDWVDLSDDAEDGEDVIERRTLDVLEESGVEVDDAKRATTVIRELAYTLQLKFDGKIQRRLRDFGERMVTALVESFQLESLSEQQAREAFAYWLQNVANLPISLGRQSSASFCDAHGTTAKDLVQAADDLDLNVAALDDLVHYWVNIRDADVDATADVDGRAGPRKRQKRTKRPT